MVKTESLWSREFIGINAIAFLTYCNIAIFFEFHDYLATLNIPPKQIGFLIALFSISALIIRPIISPMVTDQNSKKWMFTGCCFLIGSLTLYNFSTGFWSMAITRALHGATYVMVGTAVTSKLVSIIPKDRSAEAFGMVSVITLLPFAVVPPLMDPLSNFLGGFDGAINVSAAMMLINLPLIGLFKNHDSETTFNTGRYTIRDGWLNLRNPQVWSLLVINLIVWTSFTTIFFYLKGFGDQIGISNPGFFFTVSTFTEMAVRVLAGHLFDKADKKLLLTASIVVLVGGYVSIGMVSGPTGFFILAFALGLGWGIILPVINGFLYDVSEPEFRGLNANLATQMFQAGFSLGPLAGGMILSHYGYFSLFLISGLFLLTAIPLTSLTTAKRLDVNSATTDR
jgi:predicted MFS family arabinose efflux permease